MSADNIIYIKQEGEKWVMWHDFASNTEPKPLKDAIRFDTKGEAADAALDLYDSMTYVEYGVCFL